MDDQLKNEIEEEVAHENRKDRTADEQISEKETDKEEGIVKSEDTKVGNGFEYDHLDVVRVRSVSIVLDSGKNLGPSEEDEEKNEVETKDSTEFERVGWYRHYIAILALIGIVLANMNRQAFNQALVKMICKKDKNPTLILSNDTITTIVPSLENTSILPSIGTTINLPSSIHESSLMSLDDSPTSTIRPETTSMESTTVSREVESTDMPVHETTDSNIETDYDPERDCFRWNSDQISLLQSAFSYGYVPLMIFSARISELYGAKWMIFLSAFGSALCCVLSPIFADTAYGFNLLVMSRVLMGLCQTGVSPALYALLTRWLPQAESSIYLPMMKVGANLGFTFGSVIAGFFSWRETFYLVAMIGFLFCLLWPFTTESDPKDSRLISRGEFNYIKQEIGRLTRNRKESVATARRRSAPWLAIFTHPVVLAFMFTKLTVKMSTDAQTQQLVMYLKSVFDISDATNGLLNGFNYALQALLTGLVAWSAQECVNRKIFGLSKTGVRRLYQGTGNFGMSFAFLSITFNMGSVTLVCLSYFILSITSMFVAGGESVLPVDLSTEYAATIMSIANFTANLSGIILPKVVAIILGDDRSNPDRWNMIWWFMACVMSLGGTLFCLLVRAEILNFDQSSLVNLCQPRSKKKKIIKKQDDPNVLSIQMKELGDDKRL